jgi:hypothetical protein
MIEAPIRPRTQFENPALISRSNDRLRMLGETLDRAVAAAIAPRRS